MAARPKEKLCKTSFQPKDAKRPKKLHLTLTISSAKSDKIYLRFFNEKLSLILINRFRRLLRRRKWLKLDKVFFGLSVLLFGGCHEQSFYVKIDTPLLWNMYLTHTHTPSSTITAPGDPHWGDQWIVLLRENNLSNLYINILSYFIFKK